MNRKSLHKRLTALLLAVAMACSFAFTAFAEEGTPPAQQDTAVQTATPEQAAEPVEPLEPAKPIDPADPLEAAEPQAVAPQAAEAADEPSDEAVLVGTGDPLRDFEEWIAARESLRVDLQNGQPSYYSTEDAETRAQLWSRLKEECISTFANGGAKIDLEPYCDLGYESINAAWLQLRSLPGAEMVSDMSLYRYNSPTGAVPAYFLIEYLDEQDQQTAKTSLENYLALADEVDTDLEKMMVVHDAMALTCEYAYQELMQAEVTQTEPPRRIFEVNGILVNRKAVCQAYAEAFQLVMNYLGIPSVIVTSNTAQHAWNAVKVDGQWYHLDVTWDDPVNDELGYVGHNNFVKSNANFQASHRATDFVGFDDDFDVPAAATSTAYDSYWWNGVTSGIYPYSSGWCYQASANTSSRASLEPTAAVTPLVNGRATVTMLDDMLFRSVKESGTDTITQYRVEGSTALPLKDGQIENYGIARIGESVYYTAVDFPEPAPDWSNFTRTVNELPDLIPLDVPIDEAHFPDANFRAYVSREYDKDRDGLLSKNERESVSFMLLMDMEIADLTGIVYFTKLTNLQCSGNRLTTLDVSKNVNLNTLNCADNGMTTLILGEAKALATLMCQDNDFTSLDVSGLPALKTLHCFNGCLNSLNVTGCTALEDLTCFNNQLLTLDLSGLTALESVTCPSNRLISLNVTGCTALTSLECEGNQLSELDCTGLTALTALRCENNNLKVLKIADCTAMTSLKTGDNWLTSLDVSHMPELTVLLCDDNRLSALDLTKNTKLRELKIEKQKLTGGATIINGIWRLNLKNLVGADGLNRVQVATGQGKPEYKNGIVTFGETRPETFQYTYQTTDSEEEKLMDVTVELTEAPPAPDGMHMDDDGQMRYYQGGQVQTDVTGFTPNINGNNFYVKRGVLDTSYFGLAKYDGGSFLAANGLLAKRVSGLVAVGDEWHFLAAGQWQDKVNDLVEYDGAWFLLKNGQPDTSYNGMTQYDGGNFLVAGGQINQKYNGLFLSPQDGKWYYLSAGKWQDKVNDLVEYDGAWFLLKNGQPDTSYNGMHQYDGGNFLVSAGQVNQKYNGLFQSPQDGKWYYLSGGQQQSNYIGLAEYGRHWFYINQGILDVSFTGWVDYDGKKVHVVNGMVV